MIKQANLTIQNCEWQTHEPLLTDIRETVFCKEQKVSTEEELDGKDELASTKHLIAYYDNEAIATARLLESGQIGRLAVLPDFRKQGIGLSLLKRATELALVSHIPRIYLHAQTHAISLYQQAGYAPKGNIFVDAGIDHQEMVFNADNSDVLETFYGGEIIRLSSPIEIAQHISQIALSSHRYLDIFSHHLDQHTFSNPHLIHSLSQFARSSRYSRIRILLQDTKPLWKTSHPISNLLRRLPSKAEIRLLTEQTTQPETAYAISDNRRLVYLNNEEKSEGFVNYKAPGEARRYTEEFEYLWQQHSKNDPNLSDIPL